MHSRSLQIQIKRLSHFLASALAVTAQRLPFIKHLAPLISSPVSLRVATPLTVSFTGTHSLTGQTTTVQPLAGFESEVTVQVGDDFIWLFQTQRRQADSYEILGLPGGISYQYGIDGRNFGGTLSGRPTEPGSYGVTIIGWENPNFTGDSTPDFTLLLNIVAAPVDPFTRWRQDNFPGSAAADDTVAGPQADPDGDGLSNVLEYFLDLDPNVIETMPGSLIEDPQDETRLLYQLPISDDGAQTDFTFQRNTSLQTQEWTDIPRDDQTYPTTVDGDTVTLSIPKNNSEFFRLVVTL